MGTTKPYAISRAAEAANADRAVQSSFGLLRRLMDELATLLRQELVLAAAEVTRSMRVLLAGAAALAVGGAVLFAGVLILLAAAVLGLATVLRPWLAALAVGSGVAIVGGTLVAMGLRSFDPSALKPSRTAESLRKDRDVLTRR